MTNTVMLQGQVMTYGNPVECLRDAVTFYSNTRKPLDPDPKVVAEREAREKRIAMSGPATDATSDWISGHSQYITYQEIEDEIAVLDKKIEAFSKMDYAWSEVILYDLRGVRMVLEDALKRDDLRDGNDLHPYTDPFDTDMDEV